MVLMVLLFWTLCSLITYAVFGYIMPWEVEGEETFAMAFCFITWPFLAIWGIGYVFFTWLSHFGEWVRGFLEGLFRKEEK